MKNSDVEPVVKLLDVRPEEKKKILISTSDSDVEIDQQSAILSNMEAEKDEKIDTLTQVSEAAEAMKDVHLVDGGEEVSKIFEKSEK